jgi:predicted AAA+ superfamily ATPase
MTCPGRIAIENSERSYDFVHLADGVMAHDYIQRLLRPPAQSLFLFGPRGTGKTTWVRHELPGVHRIDLLDEGRSSRTLLVRLIMLLEQAMSRGQISPWAARLAMGGARA